MSPHTQVFSDIRSHLCFQPHLYFRFLTLAGQLRVTNLPSTHVEQIIEEVASILVAAPLLFYQLNPLFHPDARVEFDTRSPLMTSFVLRVRGVSKIVNLSRSRDGALLELHNLSALQFGEILTHSVSEGLTKEDLRSITNVPLQDCLAQLAQDLIDDPETSKIHRKQALRFLRRPARVPPSLLLRNIEEHSEFDFTFLSDLSKGTSNGLQVIIKRSRPCRDSPNSSEIIRETIICRQVHHPNILPILGVTFDEQHRSYGLVTPFMKYGNVIKFLKVHPDVDRVTVIWQITKGLEFLHRHDPPIAHRDIKGANVLVDDQCACRLADFGLARIPEISQRPQNQVAGTFLWMAPEILRGLEGVDLFKADVFSLAITILEIYIGEPPNRFAQQDLQPCLPPICPRPFPSDLNELVSEMLGDPNKRPPAPLVCQAIEDNLLSHREINIGTSNKEPDTAIQTISMDCMSARDVMQAWVKEEQEREKLEMQVAEESAVPLSPHERNVSQEDDPGLPTPPVSPENNPERFTVPSNTTEASTLAR